MTLETRSPVMVVVLVLITCGLYLPYWYFVTYRQLESISGHSPTGLPIVVDFIIAILTVGLWGIYIDYCISRELQNIRKANQIEAPDSMMLVLALDSVSIFTVHVLFVITCSIQQHEWNEIVNQLQGRQIQYPNRQALPAQTKDIATNHSTDGDNPYQS
ncbi:MAG: DUF4234 domain-containing protein [Leptonema sp. (in: Bacteria)]|nr:DUF4234 domain-containing protein [Leptonema sp. (in: bacteria)]